MMTHFQALMRGTALALCLPGSAALADLTAAEVWEDWKSYMASAGYDMTASETTSGDTLTVSDVTMAMALGADADEGTVSIALPQMRFVEQGDGTVAIELPEATTIDMTLFPEPEERIDMTVNFTQSEAVMIASGDTTALVYDYTAAGATLSLSDIMVDGAPVGADIASLAMEMSGIAYTTETSVGDVRDIAQTMRVESAAYDVQVSDPEAPGALKVAGVMQGLGFEGTGTLPIDTDMQDVDAMLDDGFAFDGTFTTDSGTYDASITDADGNTAINGTSNGANVQVAMTAAGLLYDVTQNDVALNVLNTQFPLPLAFAAREISTGMLFPVQQSDVAQDFRIATALRDFTMSDVIWGLFDPQAQLPRDPATISVDLSGEAKVLFDILDPAEASALEETGAAPAELDALTLNTLEVDAVGAQLTGTGDFTFDNSDTVTFDGLPRPEGTLDLSLVGGNALLDKLVALGFVPEEQAMGARMMMGLFAVPGDGPDTLTSKVEVTPEGQVLANGQRIR